MHEAIKPLYLYIDPTDRYLNLCIRISPENIQETVSFVTATFKHIVPNRAFTYRFYDTIFDEQYRRERKEGALLGIFATLSILIACLGLLGLASLTVEQRTKEIGIRKVLGASHWKITALLTKDYARWGLIGGMIGWPIAWVAANRWLQSFAFRIDVNWGLLVVASTIQLALVLLVVGYQAFRASLSNPVDSLRHE
jgi:putative ABC transport system permease protein